MDQDLFGDLRTPPYRLREYVPRWLRVLAIVAALAIVGMVVRIPYYSIGPGPTRDVLAFIRVTGTRTYPSKGKLLLTTASVSSRPLTLWEALVVWGHPGLEAIHRDTIFAPGNTDEEQDAANQAAMAGSKLQAEVAALEALGCRVSPVAGARVLSVIAGAPAHGKLRPGDLVLGVDGRRARSFEEVFRLLRAREVGDRVSLRIRRGTRRRAVTMATIANPDGAPSVGAHLGPVYRLPFEVEIDTARIVGPSGGLVFALSIADAFTPVDLTRGRVVAVTGTIGIDGAVHEVGGVPQKVRGAERDGATLFVVPSAEFEEARKLAPTSMRVIGVRTLGEAVRALVGGRRIRIEPSICRAR